MIHLIKLAVGIRDFDHLVERQKERRKEAGPDGATGRLFHYTRHVPRRADEILAGGSIYWVIKGFIRARQRIVGIERLDGEGVRKRCALELDPGLAATQIRSMRAFQGWRYFEPAQAPADIEGGRPADESEEIPEAMASELRSLGLL